jgi:hypothetical protein
MGSEFLAASKAEQGHIDLLVFVQNAAQDALFGKCELVLQICEERIVHVLLLPITSSAAWLHAAS